MSGKFPRDRSRHASKKDALNRRRVTSNGYYVIVMPDKSRAVHECPGCGRSVKPGEDYVVALEYELEPGFSLHHMTHAAPATTERRFHVEHFRGRLGDRFYALVDASSPSPEPERQ